MSSPTATTDLSAIAERLRTLEAERASASLEGLTDVAYLVDLQQEIDESRAAYVGAAVTEIATLRGQLSGPQQG